jgi:hypothetical protein
LDEGGKAPEATDTAARWQDCAALELTGVKADGQGAGGQRALRSRAAQEAFENATEAFFWRADYALNQSRTVAGRRVDHEPSQGDVYDCYHP